MAIAIENLLPTGIDRLPVIYVLVIKLVLEPAIDTWRRTRGSRIRHGFTSTIVAKRSGGEEQSSALVS